MYKLLNKINSQDLIAEAQELFKIGRETQNLSARYKYWQEAKSLQKIANELIKYELPTRGY